MPVCTFRRHAASSGTGIKGADMADERVLVYRSRIRTFWFYGSSSMAYGIKDNAFSYILLTFANNCLGVPGYLASAALAIAIIWDAVDRSTAWPLV